MLTLNTNFSFNTSRMSTIFSIMFESTNMFSYNKNQTFNAEHEQNKKRKSNKLNEYNSSRRTQKRLSYDVILIESFNNDVLFLNDVFNI
jgi:hypothetical protein